MPACVGAARWNEAEAHDVSVTDAGNSAESWEFRPSLSISREQLQPRVSAHRGRVYASAASVADVKGWVSRHPLASYFLVMFDAEKEQVRRAVREARRTALDADLMCGNRHRCRELCEICG